MIRPGRLALLVLAGCSATVRRDCKAARAGLAEARRRDRMAAYAETFGDPRP